MNARITIDRVVRFRVKAILLIVVGLIGSLALLPAKKRAKNPWSVRPYKVWKFNLPFSSDVKSLGGVAYDAKQGRIFISQKFGDGSYPVIHVYEVAT